MSLAGLRVLVTRPAHQAQNLLDLLAAEGAIATHLPLFEIRDAGDPAAHHATLDRRRDDDGWIFTSANAAIRACRLYTGEWPALFATGEATAQALADGGHPGARVAESSAASEMLLEMPALVAASGRRFLLCTGVGGRDHLADVLRARGGQVERLDLYERVEIAYGPEAVEAALAAVDAVIVTSGDGLARLWALAPESARPRLRGLVLVVPSRRVIEQALRLGFAAPLAPAQMSDANLVRCLEQAPGPSLSTMTDPAPDAVTDSSGSVSSGSAPAGLGSGTASHEPLPGLPPERPRATPRPSPPDRKRTGLLRLVLWFVLLALIALAGWSGWEWWQQHESLSDSVQRGEATTRGLANRVTGLEAQGNEIATRQADLSRTASRNATEIAALQASTQESQRLMGRISDELSGGRTRFQLAAIESLLVMAIDRLQLEHDASAALTALETADERLAEINDPRLFTVREAIAEERTALRALPRPDIASTALSLGSLIDRVPQLPLIAHAPGQFVSTDVRDAEAAQNADLPGWRRLLASIGTAARSLFTIRRDDNSRSTRLLPPEEEALVYQVLTLKLESARVALLRGNTAAYRDTLRSAGAYLDQQFKPDDPGVLAARGEIERLKGLELSPPLPEIGRSLERLRAQLEPKKD